MLLNAVKIFFLTSVLFLSAVGAVQDEDDDGQPRLFPVISGETVPEEEDGKAVQNARLAREILDRLQEQEANQNPVERFKALQQAAKLGNQDALYLVALMIEQGNGCEHTDEEATYKAYVAAAESMHPEALCWMGNYFRKKEQFQTALEFYDLATQEGCPRTADLAKMLRTEIAENNA